MSAIARIAEFVVKTRLDDCPRDAIASVRRAALDSIGVMLAGSTEPIARIVREVARAEGGTPPCTVVGASLRTRPAVHRDHRDERLRRGGGASARPRSWSGPPRDGTGRRAGVGAEGELWLDDQALSRGPRCAERRARRLARA